MRQRGLGAWSGGQGGSAPEAAPTQRGFGEPGRAQGVGEVRWAKPPVERQPHGAWGGHASSRRSAVSYTHLTLPTICSV
eukprot:2722875-Alexandrium_andersonii.AAC.1